MWRLGPQWRDEAQLARTWREAQPFAHLVLDDFVAEDALPGLMAILEDEAVERYAGEIFAFDASAPEPATPEFRGLRDAFGALLAPALTRRLIERYLAAPAPGATSEPAPDLTSREREVWLLIARGLSNQEVGQRLFLSEATVKAHVTRLLAKLGVRDRVQAVVAAYESGLVVPGDVS